MSILPSSQGSIRLAYVVEGSHVYHNRTGADLLVQLWRDEIPRAIGCPCPDAVFGINKGSVAALRLRQMKFKRTTSIAEPLDDILERHRKTAGIDCFVVIWDLVPPWDKQLAPCRWNETLALYEGLSLSKSLAQPFRQYAERRFAEMTQRTQANARARVPRLARGTILPVCVKPLFESVFIDEDAMRRCLGVRSRRVRDWPARWQPEDPKASDVIASAVDAAGRSGPNRALFNRIGFDYETRKTEWGIHFLHSGLFDETLRAHSFGKRLGELVW
jgi:hypothetical protein